MVLVEKMLLNQKCLMIVKNKGWLAGQKSKFLNFEMYKKISNHVTNVFKIFFEILIGQILFCEFWIDELVSLPNIYRYDWLI